MVDPSDTPRLVRQAYEKAEAAGKLDMKNEEEFFAFLETLTKDEADAVLQHLAEKSD
ncbi:MAG: hypothetical protein AAFN80_11355 [Pseudomonadota bacterium]